MDIIDLQMQYTPDLGSGIDFDGVDDRSWEDIMGLVRLACSGLVPAKFRWSFLTGMVPRGMVPRRG